MYVTVISNGSPDLKNRGVSLMASTYGAKTILMPVFSASTRSLPEEDSAATCFRNFPSLCVTLLTAPYRFHQKISIYSVFAFNSYKFKKSDAMHLCCAIPSYEGSSVLFLFAEEMSF